MILERLFGDPPKGIRKLDLPISHIAEINGDGQLRDGEDYFRIGVAEVFVKDLSTFLTKYSPLVYSRVTCQVGTRNVSMSHVIDPRKDSTGARGRGLIRYHPVIAPTPYTSSDVAISVALLRVPIAEYLPQVVRILTSVASMAYADLKVAEKMAGTITDGVSSIVKDENSFLLGMATTYGPVQPLVPGYFVLTRDPEISASRLWVRDEGLYIGDSLDSAIPYERADFIVYRVDRIHSRADYKTVDPVGELYQKCIHAIQTKHTKGLNTHFNELVGAVSASPQFTLSDVRRITVAVQQDLKARWEIRKQQAVPFKNAQSQDVPSLKDVTPQEYDTAKAWQAG